MTGPTKRATPERAAPAPRRPRRAGSAGAPAATEPAAAPAAPEATPATATAEPAQQAVLALYLLRHADAGDPMAWAGDDADRPLSRKGRRQARRLGRHLGDLDVQPDVLLTSPKVRAAETAKLVGRGIGVKASIDDRLAVDFGREALAGLLRGLPAEVTSVLLVGHDPDFSDAATWLVGAQLTLRKGALALIELPDRDAGAARGSLRWLLPPDAVAG
jgi:phosphohistidine phosphatase